jgi:hypothetical protein
MKTQSEGILEPPAFSCEMKGFLQSREYKGFRDFTILGSQFEREHGLEWQVILWSKSDPTLRVFCVSNGKFDRQLVGERLEAVKAAIREWEPL